VQVDKQLKGLRYKAKISAQANEEDKENEEDPDE